MADFIKAILFGVIEGITEWLPISSTGHMILFEALAEPDFSSEFRSFFLVAVQLAAVLAVLILRRDALFCSPRAEPMTKRKTAALWCRAMIATIPAAAVGFLLDDWLDARCSGSAVVAAMLILYGVAFLLVERLVARRLAKGRAFRGRGVGEISKGDALLVGCFETLSLVPGTSRSGATILGAMLLGFTRPAASEFSFLLAVPVMLGASLLRGAKLVFGGSAALTGTETLSLLAGCAAAFAVSLFTLNFLTDFVRRHTFRGFAVYRILLGAAVVLLISLGE